MRDRRNRWEILYGNSRQAGKINRQSVIVGLLSIGIVIFLILVLVGYLGSRGKANDGIVLIPDQEIAVKDPICFMQKDPEWAKDRLGGARDTMASSGCLVTALASGLDMQAREEGRDFYITPGELNAAFSAAGAYTDGGSVIWDKVPDAVPETDIVVIGTVSEPAIAQIFSEGHYPVVKVRVGGNGAFHWVLLIGADKDQYYCMDPLSDRGEPVSLASFGNRIYSIRSVFLKEQ